MQKNYDSSVQHGIYICKCMYKYWQNINLDPDPVLVEFSGNTFDGSDKHLIRFSHWHLNVFWNSNRIFYF